MSLRLRLTLVSTMVLAIVLSAFGGGVYILLSRILHNNLDATLRTRAAEVLRSPFGIDYGASLSGTYVQTLDSNANIINETGFELLPINDATKSLARGQHAGQKIYDIQVRNIPLRMLVVSVSDQNRQPLGAVMVAASRKSIDDTMRRLRLILLWAGVFGLLLAGSLSWQAARAALRPVEEVADAATSIGDTGDLSRRVRPAGDEELGRLTNAFNGMLDQLSSAHDELERTVESQRRFVADASHELRTPLTTMRGNLEIMRANPTMSKGDRIAALQDAIEEGERMSRLVEDLLALARTDARASIPPEPVSLAEVAREGVAVATAAADGRAPSVSVEADESVLVHGSSDLLRRVVTNLVENAIKFTPASGHIAVDVGRSNGYATITVSDNGIGMSSDELAHAFDRFWRSDAARAEPGSGLGLAIVKAVVEEHGGRIDAASEPGTGTTFTVRLPAG